MDEGGASQDEILQAAREADREAAREAEREPVELAPLSLELPDRSSAPEAARLRVYIGAAPGVGKTYQMLEAAHILRNQGVDIVIGLVETHGRADTVALVHDLEIVPQKEIPYRSVILREMDLDAILKRHPHTVIVDELAHTNVPGSRNRKRYEDVLELLEAGINVMTAVNVQHLETLNDAVARSASTVIRETVPDSLLKRADEVVNVDVTVDELRDRLRQGKIYAPEKIEQSLANFFRKGNLNMLRELALRTTAEQVGSAASEYRRNRGLEQAPMPEKVMVCISSRPGTERLLRVGARIAGRLATNWYAVYVESPDEEKRRSDGEAYQRMEEYVKLASDLGAKVVMLKSKHVADALIAFAQQENISHVVFGQSARSRFDILLRGSVLNRFLFEIRDVTVQVVPMTKPKR
jgi:two-component system sensor histidine kinase KdpD